MACNETSSPEMGENPNTYLDLLQYRNKITTGPGGVMDREQRHAWVACSPTMSPIPAPTSIPRRRIMSSRSWPTSTAALIWKTPWTDAQEGVDPAQYRPRAERRRQRQRHHQRCRLSGVDQDRTPLDKLGEQQRSERRVRLHATQVRAFDDGFQASASPADQAALNQLRYQWRLMKTVQPLAEDAQGANIDPGDFSRPGLSPRHASWTDRPEASPIPAWAARSV